MESEMSLLTMMRPHTCAAIAIDCLNTFMKADGKLSLSSYQKHAKGLDQDEVQKEIDFTSKRMGEFRRFLYKHKIPQIQFQDGHVIESIHGKRFHSLEIVRENEEPDFLRTFPPHALLDRNRRYGTPDQQPIDEIAIPYKRQVIINWLDEQMPPGAAVEPETELIFYKDDFCMSAGTPFVHDLFWELRRQGRFYLIVFGVCDEICNLRNVMLMLSTIFNVLYIKDCTFPLDPDKREIAIDYMKKFNPLGDGSTGQFEVYTSEEILAYLRLYDSFTYFRNLFEDDIFVLERF